MKNIDYDDILSQLSRRRQDNLRIQDRRKAELYEKLPRVKEIDDELVHMAVQEARARIMRHDPDTAQGSKGNTDSSSNASSSKALNQTLKETLREERRSLIRSSEFPDDYLLPVYTCSICKDSGYVNGNPCTCLKQMVISQLYEQSTIQNVLNKENFDTFDLSVYRDEPFGSYSYTPYKNASNILAKVKDFTENFQNKRPGILLYGETGTGKTFLTNCIAKSLLDKGYTVLYLSAINLFDNILRDIIMKNNHEQHQEMLYDYIYNCDFLIIDDLGTELTNSFVQSQLFEIINKRTIRNQSTLISTNLDLKMIRERYTERIMSRIVDSYLIFNLYGDNIRYMKRMSHITGK